MHAADKQEAVRPLSYSPGARIWETFKRNRLAYAALWMVGALVGVALLADFLAYNKPIVASYQGQLLFPIFRDYGERFLGLRLWPATWRKLDWRTLPLDWAIWPPVRYAPEELDLRNAPAVGPTEEQIIRTPAERHYLGTDRLGRDVLSGLIHGTRISLTVGIISMGIAALIGIVLGALAGYFGDDRLRISRASLWLGSFGLLIGLYYGFFVRRYALAEALGEGFLPFIGAFGLSLFVVALCTVLVWLPSRWLKRTRWGGKPVAVWVDFAISRLIEIKLSIPTMLLIFTVAAIAKPSIFLVMVIIGLTGWTGIARLTRGEMLKVRSMDYIQAARALGYSELRVAFLHALPNALTSALVSIAFGVASAILVESSLSFLGLGVSRTTVTWGALVSGARGDIHAWWLAVFPGLAIFLVVTAFNLIGEGLRDAIDPRLQAR
ncbi:MAG: ABC transporter permease [Bacteroidia bacterium]